MSFVDLSSVLGITPKSLEVDSRLWTTKWQSELFLDIIGIEAEILILDWFCEILKQGTNHIPLISDD
jgi:hypothetical protein